MAASANCRADHCCSACSWRRRAFSQACRVDSVSAIASASAPWTIVSRSRAAAASAAAASASSRLESPDTKSLRESSRPPSFSTTFARSRAARSVAVAAAAVTRSTWPPMPADLGLRGLVGGVRRRDVAARLGRGDLLLGTGRGERRGAGQEQRAREQQRQGPSGRRGAERVRDHRVRQPCFWSGVVWTGVSRGAVVGQSSRKAISCSSAMLCRSAWGSAAKGAMCATGATYVGTGMDGGAE